MCKEYELVKKEENERQLEEEETATLNKEGNPPVDCSKATHYYPEAGMDTPNSKRGRISPLTNHACTHPDQNTTIYENVYRYGTSCCAYDFATEQCGLWENDYYGYTYTNGTKGMFLYPCSFGPTTSKNIGAIAGGVIGALICAFAVAYIAFKKRKRRLLGSTEAQQNKQDEERNGPIERKKDQQDCYIDGNKATNYENITPVPLPSAPPKEEYDIAIASPVNYRGDNQIVYDAQIVTDNI
jgi:hypothetical protein